MATNVGLRLNNGQVIAGVNWRIDPANQPMPPAVFTPGALPGVPGLLGMYHIRTPLGWVDVPITQLAQVPGNPHYTTGRAT